MLIIFKGLFPGILVLQLLNLHDAVLLDEFDLERSSLLTHGSFKVGKGLPRLQSDLVDQDICSIHAKEERLAMTTCRDDIADLRIIRCRFQEFDNDSQRDLRRDLGDRLGRVPLGRRSECCA